MCYGRDSEGQKRNRSGNTCVWTQPNKKRKPLNIRGRAKKKRADTIVKVQIKSKFRLNTEVFCVFRVSIKNLRGQH